MHETSPISAHQLPSVGSLFKEAWAVYAKNFWRYILITLAPAAILIVLSLIIIPLFVVTGAAQGSGPGLAGMIILGIVAAIVVIVASVWGYASLFAAVRGHVHHEPIDFKAAYRSGWKKFWPFLGISILSGIIIAGGFILLVIPGIILSIWFAFGMQAVFDSDKRGLSALLYSKSLVSGHWWEIFWRLLVVGIVIAIINWIIQTLLGDMVSQLISGLFLTPFSLVYGWVLYEKMKAFKSDAVATGNRGGYIALAVLGTLVILGGIVAAILVPALAIGRMKAMEGMDDAKFNQMMLDLQAEGKLPAGFDWNIEGGMPNDGRVY